MPIATPEVYAEMIDRAKAGSFAYPAINVSSSQTLNAAIKGFADAGSDGIIQVSTGGAEYFSGPSVKNMVTGSLAFAAYAQEVAKNYPVNVALHTDHCPKDKLDGFVRPLLDISAERVARGEEPLFQSHMWDGSAVPLEENLQIAEELLAKCAAANVILEIEVGVVGGEEDGIVGAIDDKLYTTLFRSPSSGVEKSLSLETSATTPSSSPPTTPTSISRMIRALAVSASSSSAMERFSSTGTAEPSHMWDWNSGSRPSSTRCLLMAMSGRM